MAVDIDWRSIAGAVAPFAPKLGSVLGAGFGPVGAIVGGLAGSAIAQIFGVEETPEAVGKAIAEDPDAASKLQQLETERGQEILAQAQVEVERLKQETEQDRIAATDTQDARQFTAQLATINSPLSWGSSILATVFTVAFFVMLALVVSNTDAFKENPTLTLLMGTLVGSVNQIINYFFGSSAGSRDKDAAFQHMAANAIAKPNPSPAAIEAIKTVVKKR